MAKDTKKEESKETKRGGNLPKKGPLEGHVGVDYIADGLGITASSARVKLRNAEIAVNEKAGGAYSWTKKEADGIIKQLKGKDGAKDKKAA